MFRLTFRRTDTDDDPAAWNARVRDAVPESMFVAAYLEKSSLAIYVDIDHDFDASIHAIVAALGLGECQVCDVVPLTNTTDAHASTPVRVTGLAKRHSGRIVGVSASPDGGKLLVKVRHTQYERVDRVDRVETADTVQLTAWVGSDEDDPRAEYATLVQSFSDVIVELDRPLGGRRCVYDVV